MGTVLAPTPQRDSHAESARVVDFQTAALQAADRAWTTWGQPEERRGGPGAYAAPHLRYRHYHAELTAWVALGLEPAAEAPDLQEIAAALDRPARPLFIGRKPCLPAARLVAGWQDAEHVLGALQSWVRQWPARRHGWRAQWPSDQGSLPSDRQFELCDERNWSSGLHGGTRPVREGVIPAEAL
jgi:CRISPR system Cascade subunit CasD